MLVQSQLHNKIVLTSNNNLSEDIHTFSICLILITLLNLYLLSWHHPQLESQHELSFIFYWKHQRNAVFAQRGTDGASSRQHKYHSEDEQLSQQSINHTDTFLPTCFSLYNEWSLFFLTHLSHLTVRLVGIKLLNGVVCSLSKWSLRSTSINQLVYNQNNNHFAEQV